MVRTPHPMERAIELAPKKIDAHYINVMNQKMIRNGRSVQACFLLINVSLITFLFHH